MINPKNMAVKNCFCLSKYMKFNIGPIKSKVTLFFKIAVRYRKCVQTPCFYPNLFPAYTSCQN